MLSEGASAPGFELPALVDGERRRVSLAEYLGDNVVILAFYPADFNPACDDDSCDLDELDLFTMQKDVAILGISPDSVYSHRVFAETYDLKVPLLADTDGEVAQQYGLDFVDDIGQHLTERAVVVLDHDGTVRYVWSTDELTELPRVEAIKDALAETGGDDTAFARYRVGHAHYIEGRRAFTSAMESFRNTEWMLAQSDFDRAREEFNEAADHFDTATRFVDEEELEPIYSGANEKATALWQAADWLTRSASAYSSGSGAKGQELRDDAERPMETVREFVEPPDPDEEWPPDLEDLKRDPTSTESILPTEEEGEAATLTVDIDDEVEGGETEAATAEADEADEADADQPSDEPDVAALDDDIDDDELAEIQAELEANNPDEEPGLEDIGEESTSMVDAPPGVDTAETEATGAGEASDSTEADEQADADVSDGDLDDIGAEVAANNPDEEPAPDDIPEESTAMVEAPPGAADAAETGADSDAQTASGEAAGGSEPGDDAEPDTGAEPNDDTPSGGPETAADAAEEPVAADGATVDSAAGSGAAPSEGDAAGTAPQPDGEPDDADPQSDESAAQAAKDELAELQAKLGVELPDSGDDESDGDD